MKKIIVTLFTFFIISYLIPCAAKEELNVKSNDFGNFGRYMTVLETNEVKNKVIDEEKDDNTVNDDIKFELNAIKEVQKRYESNSVELQLSGPDEKTLAGLNSQKLFKIRINEEQYRIENEIKNENIIWDDSKNFKQSIFASRKRFAPIPSIINSSKLISKQGVEIGQVSLHDALGTSLSFMSENESSYDTGAVWSYKNNRLKIAAGTFANVYGNSSSGGIILSSEEKRLPLNSGLFSFGGAFGKKEDIGYNKTTGGVFGEYRFKRFKLNAQAGTDNYSDCRHDETVFGIIPELRITDSLSLKTRFIRNMTQNTMQDELVLSYSPKKSSRNFVLEFNASNSYGDNSLIKQRMKISASFKI